MTESNEYGNPCEKCGMWVRPYSGFSIFKLTFCSECHPVILELIQNKILGLMGIK